MNMDELVNVIQSKSSSGYTGTLFIRSQDSHMIMIAFDRGDLIRINGGRHKGIDTLPILMDFTSGTYNATESVSGNPQPELPTTAEFIELLRVNSTVASTGVPSTNPVTTNVDSKNLDSESAKMLLIPTEQAFKRIGQILIDFIGPIGAMLCQRKAAKLTAEISHSTALDVLTDLASDVANQKERKRFFALAEKTLEEYLH